MFVSLRATAHESCFHVKVNCGEQTSSRIENISIHAHKRPQLFLEYARVLNTDASLRSGKEKVSCVCTHSCEGFFRLQQTCLKLPNFLYAFVAVLCLCIAEFCFLHPPAALAHSLSCQRHSGLEAGKQAEELRTDSISLKVCVCRGPE